MLDKTIDFFRRRVKNYSIILFTTYALVFIYALFFKKDSLTGIDYSSFYSAGQLVLEGKVGLIYNVDIHHNVLESVLGREIPFMLAWFYPPIFLLMIMPFVLFPYKVSLLLWIFITLLIYLLVMKKISLSNKSIYIAMGFPGVLMNFHWGQNGFIVAALIGLGVYYLEKKPILSGIMFSVLCFKPHFALFIFVILFLSKHFKVLIYSVISLISIMIISSGFFGIETWIEYIKVQLSASNILLGPTWYDTAAIQPTLFSFLRLIGITDIYALYGQALIAIMMLFVAWWIWKHVESISIKGIILVTTIMLCTPYYVQYDLIILILPLIWYLNDCKKNGWLKIDIWTLLIIWLTPLINLPLVHLTKIQIVPISLMIITISTCIRVYHFHIKSSKT